MAPGAVCARPRVDENPGFTVFRDSKPQRGDRTQLLIFHSPPSFADCASLIQMQKIVRPACIEFPPFSLH